MDDHHGLAVVQIRSLRAVVSDPGNRRVFRLDAVPIEFAAGESRGDGETRLHLHATEKIGRLRRSLRQKCGTLRGRARHHEGAGLECAAVFADQSPVAFVGADRDDFCLALNLDRVRGGHRASEAGHAFAASVARMAVIFGRRKLPAFITVKSARPFVACSLRGPLRDLLPELRRARGEKLGPVVDRKVIPSSCRRSPAESAAFFKHRAFQSRAAQLDRGPQAGDPGADDRNVNGWFGWHA